MTGGGGITGRQALLAAIATGIIFIGTLSENVTARRARPVPQVFLLMGQSNMSGRGSIDTLPLDARTPDPAILVYGNDGVVRPALEPIDSAINQLDTVSSDGAAGAEPGLPFARTLIAMHKAASIILVPCAKGGSALSEWSPASTRDRLFGSCLARSREATRWGQLAGILWYQGETDAKTQATAESWSARFASTINAFRVALDAPSLPVIVVGLADQPEVGRYAGQFPAWSVVQTAQARLRLRALSYVSAEGLPRNSDGLHLSTEGQLSLGQMMAQAYTQMAVEHRVRRKR